MSRTRRSSFRHARTLPVLAALVALVALLPITPFASTATAQPRAAVESARPGWEELSRQAEIIRTTRGIPHIRAENTTAAGFALAWVQMEDYGIRVVELLLSARGENARHYGPGDGDARVTGDLRARRSLRRAEEGYSSLPADLRGIYEGFAAGVNRWLELHPEDAPPSVRPDFTGIHVLARDVSGANWGMGMRYANRLGAGGMGDAGTSGFEDAGGFEGTGGFRDAGSFDDDGEHIPGREDGSNTWALGPERTTSGHAILMRNPHLAWTSGYYEAHLVIDGDLAFYGDFRIGGPFSVIGGWNARLGWSTTNNNPQLSDLYTIALDPAHADHILWDGGSVPLERMTFDIEVWNGTEVETRTLDLFETPIGPVAHRTDDAVIVVRTAGDGNIRMGEQFLAMMRAGSLDEWRDAMRMQARTQSNFTYADADGNIFYVWNAMHPVRPHPFGGDTVAHRVAGPADVWGELLPFDELPQLLNPPGGYLRNENDPFHHTNLNAVLDSADYPAEAESPRVRLRSQHSLELLHNDTRFSLEDIVALRASERMLLADRVLDDLLAALEGARDAGPWSDDLEAARRLLSAWDRTVAIEARGAVLFTEWWERYMAGAGRAPGSAASVGFPAPAERLFAEVWTPEAPMTTPRGLADAARAIEAFRAAVPATRDRWGAIDVAWGDVHRARHGRLDLPISGCDGLLGCFRVIWFLDDADGRRRVRGGDGWLSAVEFGPEPRAYTVLAYGQSRRPDSPHHEDQLADFVAHRMAPVAWSDADIARSEIRRYRPGVESVSGSR